MCGRTGSYAGQSGSSSRIRDSRDFFLDKRWNIIYVYLVAFCSDSQPDKGTTLERTCRKATGPHLIGVGADYLKMAELPKVRRENPRWVGVFAFGR